MQTYLRHGDLKCQVTGSQSVARLSVHGDQACCRRYPDTQGYW